MFYYISWDETEGEFEVRKNFGDYTTFIDSFPTMEAAKNYLEELN